MISCQDYSSDIKDLREKIDQISGDMTVVINEKIITVENEINLLQETLIELDAAYKAADEQLRKDLQDAIDGAIADVNARIEADEAQIASIAAAQVEINLAIEALQEALVNVNATLESYGIDIEALKEKDAELEGMIQGLIEADAELQKGIDAAASAAAKAQETAETALALANENAEAIAALQSAVNSLQDTVSNLESQVSILNEEVEALYKKVAGNAAAIAALKEELESLKETNEEAHEALQGQIDSLAARFAENQAAVEQALADLEESLEGEIAAALEEAKGYVDESVAALQEELDGVESSISDLYELAQNIQIDLGDLSTTVEELTTKVEELETTLEEINQFFVLGDRLTSLVFAPFTSVDGVASICFSDATFTYYPWTVKAGSAPVQGTDLVTTEFADEGHVEEYLFSPTHVAEASIASLAFVSNTVTDISTKAVSAEAPIAIDSWKIAANENGVNVLQVSVSLTGTLPIAGNTYTTVALKATIADEYLLDSEIEAGNEVAVYSDWARVYNAGEVTPYIHNAEKTDKDAVDGDATHFWDYETVYALGGTESDPAAYPADAGAPDITINDYVAADVDFVLSGALDLNGLVTVCDGKGNFYDVSKYPFEFEFSLVDFYCGDDNQADFASISDDGLISFVGEQDAADKYPVVQVVLKDTEDDAIADVRYFAIHWFSLYDPNSYILEDAFEFEDEDDATCGASYEFTISGDELLKSLESAGAEISLEYLAEVYELVGPFATAYAGDGNDVVDDALGNFTYSSDSGLVWAVTPAISQEDYEAGEADVTAYGAFVNADGGSVTFELSASIDIPEITLNYKHDDSYWSEQKDEFGYYVRVSDTTTEKDDWVVNSAGYTTLPLICDLYIGYTRKDGLSDDYPLTPSGKLSAADDYMASSGKMFIRFDEAKAIEMLPIQTGTEASDWTFGGENTKIYYKGVYAVSLSYHDYMDKFACFLYDGKENISGTDAAEASEGAKLLVGKSVPVDVIGRCGDVRDTLETFDVKFRIPLALGSDEPVAVEVTDNGYDPYVASLDGTIKIVEYEIQEVESAHRTVWSNYSSDTVTEGLADWYVVKEPVFDVENATTNLINAGGSVSSETDYGKWTTKLSEITTSGGSPAYTISYDKGTNNLTYTNNTGDEIDAEFKICIPVTVATKWQDFTTHVIVTVTPIE